MSTPQFDPQLYKVGQRQQWDAVAAAWKKWWAFFERSAQQVSDRLVDLAGVQHGQRVLDISTGIGEPAVTAAQRVGVEGHVVATDQSPGMLAVARERIAEQGIVNIQLVEADTEALDLPQESFDTIVCRWGLMFLQDLDEALRRIHRALKTGGKFATTVWATADKVPFASLSFGGLTGYYNLHLPRPHLMLRTYSNWGSLALSSRLWSALDLRTCEAKS